MESYLKILEESLRKKLILMDEIQIYNEKQCEAFSREDVQIEKFDEAIAEKGRLIEELNKLDAGFETTYGYVAEELKGNQGKNALQIKVLQGLIAQVTEKSINIQAQEMRNKRLIEEFFAKEKRQIKQIRMGSQAAYGYYQNLNKVVVEDNRVLDLKK